MEPISWREVFFTKKGLKQLREENNIIVPKEYNISTIRLAIAGMLYTLLIGIAFGMWLGSVFYNYNL